MRGKGRVKGRHVRKEVGVPLSSSTIRNWSSVKRLSSSPVPHWEQMTDLKCRTRSPSTGATRKDLMKAEWVRWWLASGKSKKAQLARRGARWPEDKVGGGFSYIFSLHSIIETWGQQLGIMALGSWLCHLPAGGLWGRLNPGFLIFDMEIMVPTF